MRIDLHVHSDVSDGTQPPREVMAAAGAAGLDVVALTDHDTFDGLVEARAAAAELGLGFCPGLELSTQVAGRSVHLLGYGCDPHDPALTAELRAITQARVDRLPAMVARLTELGFPLRLDEIARPADPDSVGRPHVADALVVRGYVADRAEAFDRLLAEGQPGYVGRYTPPLERGIALVRQARGVAVLAHPWSQRGAEVLPEEAIAALVAEHGLDGIEADHPDHDDTTRAGLHAVADRLGILALGSSDHHGAGKQAAFALGACTTSPEVYAALCALIAEREGSAVLAASTPRRGPE